MTVLYSIYTAEGLIWAADRMLLQPNQQGGYQIHSVIHRKIFRIPGLGDHNQGGLIGYFGQAYVGNQLMATWLPANAAQFGGHARIGPFARHVVQRFRLAAAPNQRHTAVGFHVGGFERRHGVRVPVFYFARNAELDPATGGYQQLHQNWAFEVDEQCLTQLLQAFPIAHLRIGLQQAIQQGHGIPMWYRNGDVPGFANVTGALEAGIRGMLIQRPGYTVPKTLTRWERLAKLLVSAARSSARPIYVRQARRHESPRAGWSPRRSAPGCATRPAVRGTATSECRPGQPPRPRPAGIDTTDDAHGPSSGRRCPRGPPAIARTSTP